VTVEVPLSRGMVALVDDEDAPAVIAAGKWSASRSPSNRTWYAVRAVRRSDGGRTTVRLHNWLTGLPYVDHIDRDGLNNTRANLREVTRSGNATNSDRRSDSRTGYKGVSVAGRRYRALLTVDGTRHHLGYYDDPAEAARAYDRVAVAMHGAFAGLNFPGEDHA
jgi:hypothetical protein